MSVISLVTCYPVGQIGIITKLLLSLILHILCDFLAVSYLKTTIGLILLSTFHKYLRRLNLRERDSVTFLASWKHLSTAIAAQAFKCLLQCTLKYTNYHDSDRTPPLNSRLIPQLGSYFTGCQDHWVSQWAWSCPMKGLMVPMLKSALKSWLEVTLPCTEFGLGNRGKRSWLEKWLIP